jgi:hypothetical protein
VTEPDALERLALRAAAAAAELAAVERLEEAEGLDAAQREALADRRTCVEHELADLAAELAALDPATEHGLRRAPPGARRSRRRCHQDPCG